MEFTGERMPNNPITIRLSDEERKAIEAEAARNYRGNISRVIRSALRDAANGYGNGPGEYNGFAAKESF